VAWLRTDNLYLDMNGIIHHCTHSDDDPDAIVPEHVMFTNIGLYIDQLLQIIQPQKVFFMAVDGVAPRAKMNQQRARRFKSAREAAERYEINQKKAKEGEIVEKPFDSNCITPGTRVSTQGIERASCADARRLCPFVTFSRPTRH